MDRPARSVSTLWTALSARLRRPAPAVTPPLDPTSTESAVRTTAPPPADQALAARAAALSSALPPLLVQAERLANTVAPGLHGRRRAGTGDDFWQFRRYGQGDPVSLIDWRQTAKRQRAYVRQQEWSIARTVSLWCASHPGMYWSSGGGLPEKHDHAQLLTLALAALLLRSGERVGLLGSRQAPATGRPTLYRLAADLQTAATAAGSLRHTSAAPALPACPDAIPRHACVVLISDFLTDPAALSALLHRLAEADVRGHLLQILDPAEETFPFEGRIQFQPPSASPGESKEDWLVPRCEDVRPAYLERFKHHQALQKDLCRSLGWGLQTHRTDGSLVRTLLTLHHGLGGSAATGGRA